MLNFMKTIQINLFKLRVAFTGTVLAFQFDIYSFLFLFFIQQNSTERERERGMIITFLRCVYCSNNILRIGMPFKLKFERSEKYTKETFQ